MFRADGKRLLFIGHDASRSGAPLLLLHFLRWLKANSDLEFEVLLRSSGELVDDYRAIAVVRVLGEDLLPIPSPALSARIFRRIKRELGWRPDDSRVLKQTYPATQYPLIYSNTVTNCLVLRKLIAPGRKIICHVHELDYAVHSCGMTDALRQSVATTARFIAVSNAVASFLEKTIFVPRGRIKTVYGFAVAVGDERDDRMGIRRRARNSLGIPAHAHVVGMCGALSWHKGTDLFIQLALNLKKILGVVPLRLVWIGGKADAQQWQLELKKTGLHDTVVFAGVTPMPEALFPAFDVFALTSREDSFPLTMLEAAACGMPIVCFQSAGGGPEFVEPDAGMTVPYLDVPAMAEACSRLLNDARLRNELGANGCRKVRETFSIGAVAPQLLAVIKGELDELA
jgi:glycosyltransferase involved in cell wall biosynthesis